VHSDYNHRMQILSIEDQSTPYSVLVAPEVRLRTKQGSLAPLLESVRTESM
jgi:hypothetical protein